MLHEKSTILSEDEYELGPFYASILLNMQSDVFFLGLHDMMLAAETEERSYTFPNGATQSYYLLKNEVPANVPVFYGGFSYSDTGKIYVRDSFILKENGFDIRYYELFHILRSRKSNKDEKRKNISAEILAQRNMQA